MSPISVPDICSCYYQTYCQKQLQIAKCYAQKTVAPRLAQLTDFLPKHIPAGAYMAIYYNYLHFMIAGSVCDTDIYLDLLDKQSKHQKDPVIWWHHVQQVYLYT